MLDKMCGFSFKDACNFRLPKNVFGYIATNWLIYIYKNNEKGILKKNLDLPPRGQGYGRQTEKRVHNYFTKKTHYFE